VELKFRRGCSESSLFRQACFWNASEYSLSAKCIEVVFNLYDTTEQVKYSVGPSNHMRGKNIYSDINVLYIVTLKL